MSDNPRQTHEATPLLQVPEAVPEHHHHHTGPPSADDASSVFSYATFHTVQEPEWEHQPNFSDLPTAEEPKHVNETTPLSHKPMIVVPRSDCSSSSSTCTTAVENRPARPGRLLIVCLCIGTALLLIDAGFVMILLNQIGTDFQSAQLAAWIQITYLVASATVQPLSGFLANLWGRKVTLVMSHTLFLVGTLLCGFAQNMTQMLVARAITGLGGGCILPLASIVVHDTAEERGRFQTHIKVTQMVGTLIGAPLGGLVHDWVGWRYCFYGNAAPCAVLVLVYLFVLPRDMTTHSQATPTTMHTKKRMSSASGHHHPAAVVDWVGMLLFGAANVALVAGLGSASEPQPWLVGGCLGAGCVLWAVFVLYEITVPSNPIMPWRMMAKRNVVASCAVNFCTTAVEMAGVYLMPQFFLGVIHASTTLTGVWNVPRIAAVTLMSWFAGRFLLKRCYPTIVVSMAIGIGAVVAVARWSAETPAVLIGLSQAAYGAVSGAVCITSMAALVVDMAKPEMVSVISLLYTIRGLGRLYSMASSASLFQANIKNLLASEVQGPEAFESVEWIRSTLANYMTLAPELQLVVEQVVNMSIQHTYLHLVLPCAVAGFLASLWTRRSGM